MKHTTAWRNRPQDQHPGSLGEQDGSSIGRPVQETTIGTGVFARGQHLAPARFSSLFQPIREPRVDLLFCDEPLLPSLDLRISCNVKGWGQGSALLFLLGDPPEAKLLGAVKRMNRLVAYLIGIFPIDNLCRRLVPSVAEPLCAKS
eukprot:scaffold1366_cov233-Pinguiococcus_pyrenoidosus.AAC.5